MTRFAGVLRAMCLVGLMLLVFAAPAMAQSKAPGKKKSLLAQDSGPSFVAGYVLSAAVIGLAFAVITVTPKRKELGAGPGDLW